MSERVRIIRKAVEFLYGGIVLAAIVWMIATGRVDGEPGGYLLVATLPFLLSRMNAVEPWRRSPTSGGGSGRGWGRFFGL